MNALHPRIRLIWILRSFIRAVLLGGVVTGITLVVDGRLTLPVAEPLLIPAGLTVLFVVLGVVHALLRYRNWQYIVGEDALYLERGVLTEVRTEVPLVRIQHVDSRRSAFERLVGLASTVVYTAGSRGADVTIPGLTPEAASDLRKRLKGLAIEADGEDAV